MQTKLPRLRVQMNGQEPRERWRAVAQHMVEVLVEQTGSNFAMFRTPDEETGRLVVECFAPAERNRQLPVLEEDRFEIPREKAVACWGVHDPLTTWGAFSFSEADPHPPCPSTYGNAERSFVQWVRQKAWFPVALDGGSLGLVILVRGRSNSYRSRDIAAAWLVAQEFVSQQLAGEEHEAFRSAVGAFNILRRTTTQASLHRGLAQCLASRYGLGWNRVWLLEESRSGSEAFHCVACLGEVTKERWSDAVNHVTQEFNSLQEELRAALAPEAKLRDALPEGCCDTVPSSFDLPRSVAESMFPDLNDSNPRRYSTLVRPLSEFGLSAEEHRFQDDLRRRFCERGKEYQPDAELYALPLQVSGRRLLLLLSQAYTETAPSPILTTAFLTHASRVIDEWEESQKATSENDDDEVVSEETRVGCEMAARARLRWLGAYHSGESNSGRPKGG